MHKVKVHVLYDIYIVDLDWVCFAQCYLEYEQPVNEK